MEDPAAHFPMQAAHTVDCAAAPHRQQCHVERLRGVLRFLLSQRKQFIHRDVQPVRGIVPEMRGHELGREAVKAGFHGRMRGEEVPRAGCRQRNVKRHSCFFHELPRTFEDHERSVPFVEMANLGLHSERAQQAPSPDSQRDLLGNPHLGSAAIQFTGNAAIQRRVCRIIRIQKEELDSPNPDLPDAQPHAEPGQVHTDAQQLSIGLAHGPDRQLPRLVERIDCLLPAFFIDVLPKVPPLIEEADARDREAEVAGCLQLVASHVAQPAGIDGQRIAQHELHAEIRDAAQRSFGQRTLKPVCRFFARRPGFKNLIEDALELRSRGHGLQLVAGDGLQYHPRIVRQDP